MYQWPKRSYSILDPYLDLNSDSKSDNINPSTGKSDKVKLYYKEVCIYVWEIISRAFFFYLYATGLTGTKGIHNNIQSNMK